MVFDVPLDIFFAPKALAPDRIGFLLSSTKASASAHTAFDRIN